MRLWKKALSLQSKMVSFWTPKKVSKKEQSWVHMQSKNSKADQFGDADGDGVKNWIDSNSFNKDKKLGIFGH